MAYKEVLYHPNDSMTHKPHWKIYHVTKWYYRIKMSYYKGKTLSYIGINPKFWIKWF